MIILIFTSKKIPAIKPVFYLAGGASLTRPT
jgi:hypothetical protein